MVNSMRETLSASLSKVARSLHDKISKTTTEDELRTTAERSAGPLKIVPENLPFPPSAKKLRPQLEHIRVE
jgi:hypothetical protein